MSVWHEKDMVISQSVPGKESWLRVDAFNAKEAEDENVFGESCEKDHGRVVLLRPDAVPWLSSDNDGGDYNVYAIP